jgi:hypothetical protein
MGILDEAIREHLDLRRRHGADDGELKQLEDEAFGPPSRPGEPDFPQKEGEESGGETGAEAPTELVKPAESGQAGEKAPPEAEPDSEAPAAEAAATEAPATEPPDAEAPTEAPPGPEPVAPPEPTEPPEPVAPPEPAEPPEPEPPEPSAPSPEAAAAKEAESTFFDQEAGELELDDLDLEIEDEPEQSSEPGAAGPETTQESELARPGEGLDESEPEAAEAPPEEPPVETFETVEHDVEQHMDPPPPPGTDEAPIAAPEEAGEEEPEPAEGDEGEQGDDGDVLEETPEFLQDQPEDDELWFEQGKPKDFDF